MQLTKTTLDILKNFAAINQNIVIKPGNKIATVSVAKDVMAEFTAEETFDKTVSIYNLNEFLGVVSAFKLPDLEFDDKTVTISEGKQKVTYVYADETLLTSPSKSITMPAPEVSFELTTTALDSIKKMSAVLAVGDLAIIGDGKSITARVFDAKNSTSNAFDIDLDVTTKEKFNILFKIEKLKLPAGAYDVEISSKKISKFSHQELKLVTYVAVEAGSEFA